jgi:hypothetical protein
LSILKLVYDINLFTGVTMTIEEIETLRRDIDELRRAVRKANPFLRAIVAMRGYALLSIPLGGLILVFCLVSHFLVRSYGSFQAVPSAWKTASWIAFAAFLAASSVFKWLIIAKRAAQIEKGATFMTAVKAMYGSSWVNLSLPVTICLIALAAFAIFAGKPWYIVPAAAVCLALICNSIGQAVERREYIWTGWYSLASGLASLFFIETAPFLWTAVVWAGIFFVYAAAGLYYLPREEREG